ENKYDIVYLSIEFTDISGIDIAQMIREEFPNLCVVFISKYDYFDFARNAVVLGVDDYLLEPVTEHDIVETTNRLIKKVENRRKNTAKEEKKEKLFDNIYELAKDSFVYSVLFGLNSGKNISDYKELLELKDRGLWLGIEPVDDMYNIKPYDRGFTKCIIDCFNEKEYSVIIGPKLLRKYIVYVGINGEEHKKNERRDIERICERLKQRLYSELQCKVNIGTGSIQKLEKLYISYEEAVAGGSRTVKNSGLYSDEIYVQHKRQLIESIELAKNDSADIFSKILEIIGGLEERDRKNKIIELLVVTINSLSLYGKKQCAGFDHLSYINEIMKIKKDELDAWALGKFQFIIKLGQSDDMENMSEIVKKAMYYVYEHYSENITLSDMAALTGVSLQYFSKLFKDETGFNFVNWLNGFRVNKAKEFMSSNQYTIKEVCFKAGFNDPNYFSRIFKKYEGKAPTEYI
ncbi:MAG: AraC family transcriptional regulator, partial [Lachnospiraceae bacterium]|nr:AraC family transcriptional regulator [Lachnospiraceae bacterium]